MDNDKGDIWLWNETPFNYRHENRGAIMNTSKHTPGPWIAERGGTISAEGKVIACVQMGFQHNARLIAAAPDLLAALLACKNERPRLRRDYHGLDADRQWDITSAAFVALAKAGQS